MMCALATLMFAAIVLGRRRIRKPVGAWSKLIVATVVVAAVVQAAVVLRANYELISNMVAFKLLTGEVSGSVSLRADFIRAAWMAGVDNPVFGLGYRNFHQVQNLYPELRLPVIGPLDNAHNLFAQLLAVGGFPAEILLALVFLTPFAVFWRKLRWHVQSRFVRHVVMVLSVGVWVTYASVQLQLIAQPPFWLFCGIVFGMRSKKENQATIDQARVA